MKEGFPPDLTARYSCGRSLGRGPGRGRCLRRREERLSGREGGVVILPGLSLR